MPVFSVGCFYYPWQRLVRQVPFFICSEHNFRVPLEFLFLLHFFLDKPPEPLSWPLPPRELAVYTRLALNSQTSSFICLPIARIKGMHQYAWLKSGLLANIPISCPSWEKILQHDQASTWLQSTAFWLQSCQGPWMKMWDHNGLQGEAE